MPPADTSWVTSCAIVYLSSALRNACTDLSARVKLPWMKPRQGAAGFQWHGRRGVRAEKTRGFTTEGTEIIEGKMTCRLCVRHILRGDSLSAEIPKPNKRSDATHSHQFHKRGAS